MESSSIIKFIMMYKVIKTIVFSLFVIFFSINIFSQTNKNSNLLEKQQIVVKILSTNNKDAIFNQLVDNTLNKVNVDSRSIYTTTIDNKANQIKQEAIDYFVQTYSLEELKIIYQEELNYDRYNRSKLYVKFSDEWTGYKQMFYNFFKKTYNLYIKN
jgi:hypothetical protein